MASQEAIAPNVAAGQSAEISIGSGEAVTFACIGLQGGESVAVEARINGSFESVSDPRWKGTFLNSQTNMNQVSGPIDIRVTKSPTSASVGVYYFS